MKKDEIIKIRCTYKEKETIKENAKNRLMNLSQYIIYSTNNSQNDNLNKTKIAKLSCEIANELQAIKIKYSNIEFSKIERKILELCQHL